MTNKLLLTASFLLLLGACSELPQQGQLEYTATATDAEFDRLANEERRLTARERERLGRIRQERLLAEVNLETWELSEEGIPRFIGYGGPDGNLGFALQASGAGEALTSPLALAPLLAGLEAIFEVLPLGENAERLLARSPRGITIWHLAAPFDALVVAVEPDTFDKTRIVDVAEMVGQNQLAVATDDNRVTWWSTRSGLILSEVLLEDHAPRVLAQNMDSRSLVFGTNTGEIVQINRGGRRASQVLYRHSGPILDLYYDATGERVLSTSKDGSVILWSSETSEELARWEFSSPVYRVERIADTTRFLLEPVAGRAQVIDIEAPEENWRILRFGVTPNVPVQASTDADLMLIRFGSIEAKIYDISNVQRLRTLRAPQGRRLVDAELLEQSRRVLLADSAGDLWLRAIEGSEAIRIMRTDGIVDIAVNRTQDQIMVSLVDGRLITLDLRDNYPEALNLRGGGRDVKA